MQIKLLNSCKFPPFSSLRIISAMDIKTFIFLDCETTGLPFQESNKTRMTEICFVAVQSEHIGLGVFPRIQNKLNFCFNPRKFISPEASRITGLTNDLLEHQTEFDASCFNVMREFLNANRKPLCLVAHNGNKFDYPILKAEIYKSGNEMASDVVCIDSLVAFRKLHENSMKRTALPEIASELNDGNDDILSGVLDYIDLQTSTPPKLTVEQIQKINETTPVKNVGGFKFRAVKRKKIFTEKLSFSLGKLYQRLTSKEPVDAHRAECDVNMLIECAATVGQPFVDWCNENAQQFCDIPMMIPGKPIGS